MTLSILLRYNLNMTAKRLSKKAKNGQAKFACESEVG